MEKLSNYFRRSFEKLPKKIFRFFSEIPFSASHDPKLADKGIQQFPEGIDFFIPKKNVFCPFYYYFRSRQLEMIEGGLPQSGTWFTNTLRSSHIWGDSPSSLNYDWISDIWKETGDFDWQPFDQIELGDAKKGRCLGYYRIDMKQSLTFLTGYDFLEDYLYKYCCDAIESDDAIVPDSLSSQQYNFSLTLKITPECCYCHWSTCF